MGVRVVFLGRLADLAEGGAIEMAAPLDWHGLIASLPEAVSDAVQGDRVNVACAGEVLADKRTLSASDGDEVALLPPVSGG